MNRRVLKLASQLQEVWIAKSFGRSIALRPELQETIPQHADMLRYDTAFHDPADPSRVIFPRFKSVGGNIGGIPTSARWASFMISLTATNQFTDDFAKWITYRHTRDHELTPVTLEDYMKGERP